MIRALLNEIDRNTELLAQYKSIGPAGAFGAEFIAADIKYAKEAIATGDTVAMVRLLAKMRNNE